MKTKKHKNSVTEYEKKIIDLFQTNTMLEDKLDEALAENARKEHLLQEVQLDNDQLKEVFKRRQLELIENVNELSELKENKNQHIKQLMRKILFLEEELKSERSSKSNNRLNNTNNDNELPIETPRQSADILEKELAGGSTDGSNATLAVAQGGSSSFFGQFFKRSRPSTPTVGTALEASTSTSKSPSLAASTTVSTSTPKTTMSSDDNS